MNITRENIGELNDLVKIKIEEKDYAEKVEKALKDYRRKANLPGFRPGRVPMGIIKKSYGRAVKAEEINKFLSESLFDYLKKEDLNYLGEPMPYELESDKNVDFENDSDFEFAFELGLTPDLDIELNKRTKVHMYKVSPEDKYIDETIENNRKRLSTETEVEAIEEEKDMFRATLVQLDAEGNELEAGVSKENVLLAIDTVKDEETKKSFMELKPESTLVFNPLKAYENETEVSSMLGADKENKEVISADYKATVEKIIRFVPAELNEEFYKKLFGEETEVKTEEEFRAEIKKKIEGEFVAEADARLFLDIRKKLSDKYEVNLPDTFLKKWLRAANKDNEKLDDETFEKEYPIFTEDLRWQIIQGTIFRKYELKVSHDDLHQAAEELVIADLQRYGIPREQLGPDFVHQFVHSMLEKKEDKERAERLAEQKVFTNFMKEQIKIEDKEISIDEFNDLYKKEEEKKAKEEAKQEKE